MTDQNESLPVSVEKRHDQQMPIWNWFSILSLVFGMMTLCTSFIPLVNLFWVSAPIGLGILGIIKSRLKVLAVFGIGFSCISLTISCIFIGFTISSYILLMIRYFDGFM